MASKILVIEDDRALRNAVVSALQSGGYEVEFAADGSAGVQALSTKTFEVVLLDIGLPFVDGWHVLSTLEGRRLPSVIIRAGTSSSSAATGSRSAPPGGRPPPGRPPLLPADPA